MRIDIVVFEGVDEMDAVGPFRVLRAATGAWLTTRLVSLTGEPVPGIHGLRFEPDAAYDVAAPPDVLVVPGGGWNARLDRGAWGEAQRGDWLSNIRAARMSGTVLAGVCTGTMLLAHAGVIGNRRAATHHVAREDLAAIGATVVTDRVVDDGDLITAGGVTSGIDLALWLVERFADRATADRIAENMEYDRVRPTNAPD